MLDSLAAGSRWQGRGRMSTIDMVQLAADAHRSKLHMCKAAELVD